MNIWVLHAKKKSLSFLLLFIVFFNITAMADDICYEEPTSEGFSIANFGMFYGVTTPIKNISGEELSDVTIIKSFDGLDMSMMDKIELDEADKTLQLDEDAAEENSDLQASFAMFNASGMFDKGLVYHDMNFTPDQKHTIYDYSMFSFDMSKIKIFATYTKNGQEYNITVNSCDDNAGTDEGAYDPTSGVFNITDNTITDGIDPLDANDAKNILKTKIINENFNLFLEHMKADKETLDDTFFGFVSIDVIHINNNNTTSLIQRNLWHKYFQNTINPHPYEIDNLLINTIDRNATFRINYIDWQKRLGYSCTDSSENNNIKGIPACLNTNSKILSSFPGTTCLNDAQTGAPCKSENKGSGKAPYDNEYGCALCLFNDVNTKSYARDNFAIRPYSFKVFGKNQYKRAGEDFNLTIKAVDKTNADKNTSGDTAATVQGVNGYDVSLNTLAITSQFYQPNASDITQMQTDIGSDKNASINGNVSLCPNSGTFTVNNANFSNGEVNATLNFSETGILNIKVSEINGSEWAIVDADDTNDSIRFIKPSTISYDENNISANILQLFVPYSFTTEAEYNTTTTKNWIYQADINSSNHTFTTPKLAAFISYKITAKNKNGITVQNYTKTCFPDVDEVHAPRVNGLKLNTTFDLFLDADINITHNANISLYSEDNTSNAIWTLITNKTLVENNNTLQEWISPFEFENGVGEAKVYFNIDRNVSQAKNPIVIKVIDANTSTSWMSNPGSPKGFHGSDLNQSIVFYYGRAHAPRARIVGTDGNVSMYYEVYCSGNDCKKSLLPDGNTSKYSDDPRWFINTKHLHEAGTAAQTATTQKNGSTNISVIREADGNSPDYIGLQYNGNDGYPYKTTMDINASKWLIYNKYNPNAVVNEFEVEFINNSGNWAGQAETDTTTKKNAADQTNRRLMW